MNRHTFQAVVNTGDKLVREQLENKSEGSRQFFEVITCEQMAGRLNVPVSWVRDQVRGRAVDPIPCLKLGKYVRFQWNSPELVSWIARRKSINKQYRH